MANKQYLIELAVKDDKLKSSLKKSLESPDIQKTLGILGEGITEYLEKDIAKAVSILGKVDWASLLGEKDFERLQQVIANTVSANKDMIKAFAKSGDTKGLQDTIEFVSELGKELKAINPGETVAGLARSMASFMRVIEPLSGKIEALANAPEKIAGAFGGMASSTNKSLDSIQKRAEKVVKSMNDSVLNAVKTSGVPMINFEMSTEDLEKFIGELKDADALAAELNKEIENSQTLLRKVGGANEKITSDRIKTLVQHEQKINALTAKLLTLQPSVNGDGVTKDIDATVEKIADKLEKGLNKTFKESFNKVIEEKLSTIRVKIDVPKEEELIAQINDVIAKVNEKGTNSFKLVGAESAINAAQNKILDNTKTWHEDMKKYLRFDKKEDITLDLGAKMREIGHNVGEQMRESIESYFNDPQNKVAVPVELVMSGQNKATLEGGNVTINGTVGGGGGITAEDLVKAFTTPIEVKVQEDQAKGNSATAKLFDYNGDFAKQILSVFDKLFDAVDRGGQSAEKILGYFRARGMNFAELKGKPMDILNAYEGFLNSGDQSSLDWFNKSVLKGGAKNKATLAFEELLRDSILRFNLDNIDVDIETKRANARKMVEEFYIPQSKARDSLSNIMFTNNTKYKIPTVEEIDKLMTDLPEQFGTFGENFLPGLKALKNLRGTISDPNNAQEMQRFKEGANKFATEVIDFYRTIDGIVHDYRIGVFYKGHSKHKKTSDVTYSGGKFSGSKIENRLDNIDYFEIYDDPIGKETKGNRQDALDRMSRREKYQTSANARKSSHRSTEQKPQNQTSKIEVSKFEPKERPDEELKEIEAIKKAAERRTEKIEEARKASEAEEKVAEELRKQQLEADKKRLKTLRSQRTKNANKLKDAPEIDSDKMQEIKGLQMEIAADEQELADLDVKRDEIVKKQRLLMEANPFLKEYYEAFHESNDKIVNAILKKDDLLSSGVPESAAEVRDLESIITEERVRQTEISHRLIDNRDDSETKVIDEYFRLSKERDDLLDPYLEHRSMLIDNKQILSELTASVDVEASNKALELKSKNDQLDAEIKELADKVEKGSVESSKKPTVKQQLDAMPKAKDIQTMIDNVNAIDAKVDEAQKKADEFDELVNKKLKAEKVPKLGYTKTEKNNSEKFDVASTKSATLDIALSDKTATKSSFAGLSKKEADTVKKLLTDRKLYQLINGKDGLGLPQNSNLEDYAKSRIQNYQNGLNKIDEFLLKYKDQTIQYVEDDLDLSEFLKDQNVTHMMAGNFKGSQEEAVTIRAKIEEFRAHMTKAGKNYIVDYLDMWSDGNLRGLMKDNKTRNATVAQGDTILQEFYHRIVDGGVSKRGEAYQYLKDESAKYQKSIAKDESAVDKLLVAAQEQLATTQAKEIVADDRLKAEYKNYVSQWLQTIQQNMADVSSDSFSVEEKALKIKKNEELRGLISQFARDYFKTFNENLLDETQKALLSQRESVSYASLRDDQLSSAKTERTQKQSEVDAIIEQKSALLKQRRFDLLKQIGSRAKKGDDTKSLEKALLEIEDELVKYSNQLPHLVREEFEVDLLNAKNATDEEWKQLKANQEKRRNEFNATKYKELQGKQKSLLGDIKTKTAAGENTGDLVKQLDEINEEIREYEVNASRIKDIEIAKFPDKASIGTIRAYNAEMTELVRLQQELAKLEVQGKDTSAIKAEIEAQKRQLNSRVSARIEEDKRIAASYDPANQAADFIEKTEAAVYKLEQRAKIAEDNLRRAEQDLAVMQSDSYKNSNVYKDKIKTIKHEAVAGYVRSDEYKAARQRAVEKADEEFGKYLAEHFDENVINELAYEFSHEGNRGDRADISAMIMTPKLKEISEETDNLLKELATTTDEAAKQGLRDRIALLRQEFDQELSAGNVGGEGIGRRLVSDSFSKMMTDERQSYIDGDAYQQLLAQKKENIRLEIEEELKSDREATETKVQEIKNAAKLRKKQIRKATLSSSEELRAAVDAQAQADGMGDSEEYKRSIVDRVKEDMLQQVFEETGESIRAQWQPYNDKVAEKRSKYYQKMYKELNAKTDEFVYNAVMSKIRVMLGEKAKTVMDLDGKRDELVSKYTKDIVDQYEKSLEFEETNTYKGQNIREMVTKEAANRVSYAKGRYVDASGQLGVLEYERNRAKSYGELGYDETLNPEIAKVRAEAEARLTAEKERQVALTEKLTTLTEQNANHSVVQSVAAELSATEKEISRLQMLSEGAANALEMRKNVREEELENKKYTPDKVRLWLIDHIEEAKKVLESGTDAEKTKASENIARWEPKLANIEKAIEAAKPEAEKPKTVLDMITHAIRDGLANVTAGGTVDLDASLYNIATETTLQEILRLLGGNGAVEYANQLKKELAKDRPKYERKSGDSDNNRGDSSNQKKNRNNSALDKMNTDGQRIYNELDAEAKVFTDSLKKGSKQYAPDFNFVDAIKKQAEVVKKQTKGSLEYVKEQTKLTVLYQDYYKKTFGSGRKKKDQPGQSAWAEKGDLGKISGLKDLLLFKSNRADALVGLGYGVNGAAKTEEPATDNKQKKTNKKKVNVSENTDETAGSNDNLQQTITNAVKAANADGGEIDVKRVIEAVMMAAGIDPNDKGVAKLIGETIEEGGLARDIDDKILSSNGKTAQVLYDAIIDAYKMIASGDGIHAETSYRLDELGNVLDVQRGTMIESSAARKGSVWGHTHAEDRLFGQEDFNAAAQNAGIFDVFELITPLNKYVISGLKDINFVMLGTKFKKLAQFAEENKNLSRLEYNDKIKSEIERLGLKFEVLPTGLAQSNNFKTIRSASLLQSASNHELSLDAFEPAMKAFVADIKDANYQFDKSSPLGQLVDAINKIVTTTYGSADDKEDAFEELRPIIEEVFGKNPDARIPAKDAKWLQKFAVLYPHLGMEIDDLGEEWASNKKQIFSNGWTLSGDRRGYQPKDQGHQSNDLGRDADVKTNVKEGVKEGIVESSNASTSDKKLPYDVSADSLIGKLQNTVGGDTRTLAQQATLALVLSELQAINKKIATTGKAGIKSSAQNLLEEFQKLALGSAMDGKERVAYFDAINGVMSPALSGETHKIPQKLIDTVTQQYGPDKGYRSRIHTHADSEQTWFSKTDLNSFKKGISDDFGVNDIKQEILMTKDTITILDMTMVETAENAKKAIDILISAGQDINNDVIENLANYGVRYQSKDHGSIGAKGLMDLIGVKNYKNDGKKKGAIADPEVALAGLEAHAKDDADKRNSKYVFNSFDGETLKYQLVDAEGNISKVILAWDELEKKVRVVSDTSTSSIDATVKKIQQYKSEIQSAKNELLLSDGDDAGFVAAEKTVDSLVQKIESGSLSGQALSDTINELEVARQNLADEGEKLHKLIAKNEKLRGGTAEVKQAITQGTRVRGLLGDKIDTTEQDGLQLFTVGDDAPGYLQKYVAEYNNLIKVQQQYIKDGKINSAQTQDSLKVQTAAVKKLGIETMAAYKKTLELEEKSNASKELTYENALGATHALGGSTSINPSEVNRETMLKYAKEVLGADLASVKLNNTTGKLTGVLRKSNYVVADMAVEYDKTTNMLHLYQEKERESLSGMPGFLNGLKAKSKAIVQYVMSMTSIYRVLGELRKGIQYIREIDDALVELRKVTDKTDETYDKFLQTAAKTGERLGATISDVTRATSTFAKLGYTIEQSTEMAEAALVYKNVGDNIASAEDAADSIISTLKGFNKENLDAMSIVDRFNEVGNRFAITSQGIGEALKLSASALSEGGNTLDESIGIITAANEVVNDPSSVGRKLCRH